MIAFGATVYLARTLGAAGYGLVGVTTAFLLYCTYLTDLGLEVLGVREIAESRHRLLTHAPGILTARIAVGCLLALLLSVVGLTVLPQPDGALLAVYSLTLLAAGGNTRWAHIGLGQAGLAAVARAIGESVMVVVVVLLVHGPGDLANAGFAQVVGDALAALLLAWWLGREFRGRSARFEPALVLPVFRRSWPLMVNALLGLAIFNSDLIFLRLFRDATTTGWYAAAYTLISFLLNLGNAYSVSLLPSFAGLATALDARRQLYGDASAQVFAGAWPVALGGALVAPDLIALVFGPGFEPSGRALQLLLWSIPLSFLRTVPQVALIAVGQQHRVLRVTAWCMVLNLGLNLLLIPRLGLLGAAGATVLTEGIRALISLLEARREGFPITGPARYWRSLLAGGGMTAALLLVPGAGFFVRTAVGALAYALCLWLIGGIRFRRDSLPALSV